MRVLMGALWSRDTGGTKNKAKRVTNSRERHILQCVYMVKKNSNDVLMVVAKMYDHRGGYRASKGYAGHLHQCNNLLLHIISK